MKMKINCGVSAATDDIEKGLVWKQVGKYICTGFARVRTIRRGVQYFMNVPVWRKV